MLSTFLALALSTRAVAVAVFLALGINVAASGATWSSWLPVMVAAAAVIVWRREPLAVSAAPEQAQPETAPRTGDLDDAITSMERELGDAHAIVSEQRSRVVSVAANIQEISDLGGMIDGAAKAAFDTGRDVTSATDQLEEAIGGVSQETDRTAEVARAAVGFAHEAGEAMQSTQKASEEVASIANVITEIAARTNLLALNATIEAARAGEAGRGFAVVASEVKDLASQTAKATEQIGAQLATIGSAVDATAQRISEVVGAIENIDRAAAAASEAVTLQRAAVARIHDSGSAAAQSMAMLSCDVSSVVSRANDAAETATAMTDQAQETVRLVDTMRSHIIVTLRQTEFGDRRAHKRVPCCFDVVVRSRWGELRGETRDLSVGGVALSLQGANIPAKGDPLSIDIAGAGTVDGTVVGPRPTGVSVRFDAVPEDVRAKIEARLAEVETDDEIYAKAVQAAAAEISSRFEHAVETGRITLEKLFDTNYHPVPDTNPKQYTTAFVDLTDQLLPPIQEPLLSLSDRVAFSAAVDRNAYLPTHNLKISQPQRPNDPDWNAANCRNRRKFDDRAGLTAARNRKPFLFQVYDRDMGGGRLVLMKEVDAPITVAGKHWGGLRIGYRFR